MTTTASLRTYLKEVIGFGQNALGTERANAVIAEGLTDFDSFKSFDKDDIKSLCYTIRRPGGTIPNPIYVAPVAGEIAAMPENIHNPGVSIPAICESRLVLAAYGSKIYATIGRDVTPQSMSLRRLDSFKQHKETVDNHGDPEAFPAISKNFGIIKALEQFPTYLEEKIGVTKIALAYVTRTIVPRPVMMPALNHSSVWSGDRNSLMEELVAFASHDGPAYQSDNATVFRILQEMLSETSHMSSIKPFQRSRNGRDAYLALKLHNMGTSKWDKIVEAAEDCVLRRKWDGRNSRYPLKNHIIRHREAHNDFERASQAIPYTIPDEHSRVRRLLHSITSNNAAILAAKTTILADDTRVNNFELAADFLILTAPEPPAGGGRDHRISAFQHNGKRKKWNQRKDSNKDKSSGDKVQARYYTSDEWSALDYNKRNQILEQRKKEGRKSSRDVRRKDEDTHSQISALTKLVEEQTQRISALTSSGFVAPPLPPTPAANPLQPPSGFGSTSQRK